MSNLTNVKVNATHICVLRKVENENKVKVDFVELKYKYQEQLDELKRMAENDNRSVLEMQDYVKGSSLRRLTMDFNFCSILSEAYQGVSRLSSISFADYQMKIKEFDTNKDENGKKRYIREKRWNYYNNISSRILPAMLEDASNDLHNDPTVLAYSHRRVGWAWPAFNLNDDIRVVYLTNFGYGYASYFFLQIFYKGIGILPYSHWVHYRKACTSDIIRYTRRYHLENQEWIKTMTFTADMYNSAVSDPASFIQNNMLNEVEEMVSGLEYIQSSSNYKTQESFFNPSRIVLTGDDMVRFKGEKISGALDFLDQLQTLSPITDNVNSYIKRIMNCNFLIVPELQKEVSNKKQILESLLSKIADEQPKWDGMSEKNDEYEKLRSDMFDAVAEEDGFREKAMNIIRKESDTRFVKAYPEYLSFKAEYDNEQKLYYNLCFERDKVQSFVDEIQKYLDKIEAHKNYMAENDIAA